MTSFRFGALTIDAAEFASHGNAVLGIRGSGKTYTATALAERLFDAGIPFFAFDPIGVWRWLRVPANGPRGRGYPVVVAGGQAADLPLTVEGTPDLVRAAVQAGVSLVFDLFDMSLSKADWRRIVTAAVRIMLHENHAHGLRHIFIEEAAEFVPQKVLDGVVYAEIEKLARMGGNVRLGYTLINQRSQEVSKAILELCENVFVHRQRGKNALDGMDKWLTLLGAADQKKIMKSLPELPQGQCWALMGGDDPQPPTLIEVPAKSSLHPDRRVTRNDAAGASTAKPVDVAEFIARMRGRPAPAVIPAQSLPKPKEIDVTKEEADTLRRENEQLRREIAELRKPAGQPSRTATEDRVFSLAETLDNEALYQAIKDRLAKEAPAILQVLAIKPELVVKIERRTIEVTDETLFGRLAGLVAEGFFEEPRTGSAAYTELRRRNFPTAKPNVYRECDKIATMGFLTKEAGGYQAVEGMKVRIVES